ncbi:MAG TPA: 30S ribosomal protein S21, partial [Gemmatimonadaceae bacterium]
LVEPAVTLFCHRVAQNRFNSMVVMPPDGTQRPIRSVTIMVEVVLAEGDRLDRALKVFKRKMQRSGILKDLRRKRHYVKPSEARALKAAAARRRKRTAARRASTSPI